MRRVLTAVLIGGLAVLPGCTSEDRPDTPTPAVTASNSLGPHYPAPPERLAMTVTYGHEGETYVDEGQPVSRWSAVVPSGNAERPVEVPDATGRGSSWASQACDRSRESWFAGQRAWHNGYTQLTLSIRKPEIPYKIRGLRSRVVAREDPVKGTVVDCFASGRRVETTSGGESSVFFTLFLDDEGSGPRIQASPPLQDMTDRGSDPFDASNPVFTGMTAADLWGQTTEGISTYLIDGRALDCACTWRLEIAIQETDDSEPIWYDVTPDGVPILTTVRRPAAWALHAQQSGKFMMVNDARFTEKCLSGNVDGGCAPSF